MTYKGMATFQAMKDLVDSCQCEEDYEIIWDNYWELSLILSEYIPINYYDPDTTYMEDILANYNTFKNKLC